MSKSAVLGIIFLVEFSLLVTDFGLVAIQATHTAHFNSVGHGSWENSEKQYTCIRFLSTNPKYA